MAKSIEDKRIDQIITFLRSLKINSTRFYDLIDKKNKFIIQIFDESLTHSSVKKEINYEKLEFFGDAVLRLAASHFIDKNFIKILSAKLYEWTRERWIITLSKKEGQFTIKELKKKFKENITNDFAKSKEFKKIKQIFKDIKIKDLK